LKKLHRSDLYCWSRFDVERNIDFNGILWVNPNGNIIIDPVPLEDYDKKHLESLGGAKYIIITNSDHVRDAKNILSFTGAKCFGPTGEKNFFPIKCDYWLKDGDKPISGIEVFSLKGSKTSGELAIIIEKSTLITGDLIRSDRGGKLNMLPDEKLINRDLAIESIRRIASIKEIEAVIPGDGWPIFSYGHEALLQLSKQI
tara:strand:- start:351 stop:950 length:600 start_codon:yes stop_codon:yes gene_type:complete